MTIPVKNGILKINAVCKLVYIAIDNSGQPEMNHAVGIKASYYRGKSRQAVRKLLDKEAVPLVR